MAKHYPPIHPELWGPEGLVIPDHANVLLETSDMVPVTHYEGVPWYAKHAKQLRSDD